MDLQFSGTDKTLMSGWTSPSGDESVCSSQGTREDPEKDLRGSSQEPSDMEYTSSGSGSHSRSGSVSPTNDSTPEEHAQEPDRDFKGTQEYRLMIRHGLEDLSAESSPRDASESSSISPEELKDLEEVVECARQFLQSSPEPDSEMSGEESDHSDSEMSGEDSEHSDSEMSGEDSDHSDSSKQDMVSAEELNTRLRNMQRNAKNVSSQ